VTTEARRANAALAPAAICVGVAALLLRPVAGPGALAVFVGVGLLGVLAPAPASDRVPWARAVAVTALGVGAFGLARAFRGAPGPAFDVAALGPTIIAAVAEEAFFRRLAYAWLLRGGPTVAVVGSAALFAMIHVPEYGWGALPVDAAAGLLLGWQRWASGGWASSCLTHIAANVLQAV
jgi:hypothetical protein